MKEGWKYMKLGEIATEMYRGSGIRRDQITTNGSPCVRYGEIYTTYNYYFDKCVSHTDESAIAPKKYFEYGDILFAITGESVEEIGKSIAYLGNNKCLAGGDIIVMKHNQNPKYLAYALSTPNAIAQKGFGKTKLKVVHTNAPSLKSVSIPVPPLPEQQRIVTYLDAEFAKIEALKANAEKQLQAAKDLFQAALKELLTPKEGWVEKKIKDVGEVIGGTTPNTNVPEFWNGNNCWISPAELKGSHYLYDSVKKITDLAIKKKNLKLLPVGTVILSSRAPIGKVVINKVPTYCNQGFKCVVCKNDLYNEFLYWFFYGNTDYLNSLGTGATFPEISKGTVENIPINYPPISEQQRIADRLDALSANVKALQTNYAETINLCNDLKQALLKKVFEEDG